MRAYRNTQRRKHRTDEKLSLQTQDRTPKRLMLRNENNRLQAIGFVSIGGLHMFTNRVMNNLSKSQLLQKEKGI